jgi:hypothetical protein
MSDGGGKTYKQGRLVMGRTVAIVKNAETGRKMAGKLIWSDARGHTRLNVGRAWGARAASIGDAVLSTGSPEDYEPGGGGTLVIGRVLTENRDRQWKCVLQSYCGSKKQRIVKPLTSDTILELYFTV